MAEILPTQRYEVEVMLVVKEKVAGLESPLVN
jgi:hypothetical protein